MGSPTCTTTKYYSGQGAVLLADRDPVDGEPTGFLPVGNVSALTLSIETEEFEHKESCTGARAIDLTIVQEISVGLAMTMESLNKENLALALFGTESEVASGAVVDEAQVGRLDKHLGLRRIGVSSVVVTGAAGTPVFVLNTDYTENLTMGSIFILSSGSITEGLTLEVSYSFVVQHEVEAVITSTGAEKHVRFEGLNTAESPNTETVVDVFKFKVSPLAELALINDEIAQMEIEGDVLSDAFKLPPNSKFFRERFIP